MTAHAGGFSLGGGSRYFRALLDSLLDAVVIADEHGAVWGYNEAAHRLFGYAPGEVVGRPVSLLMPAPCWRPDLAFVERPADEDAREASRQQVEGYRRDGSRYRCELDLTGFVVGGQRYVVGVARPSPGGIAGHALQDPV